MLILLGVAVVAVVGLAVASSSGGGDDDDSDRAARTTSAETRDGTGERPTEPAVERVRIRQGAVLGGPKRFVVQKGDTVQIVVQVDAPDDIHLHGYDIERTAGRGGRPVSTSRRTSRVTSRSRAMWPRMLVAIR